MLLLIQKIFLTNDEDFHVLDEELDEDLLKIFPSLFTYWFSDILCSII